MLRGLTKKERFALYRAELNRKRELFLRRNKLAEDLINNKLCKSIATVGGLSVTSEWSDYTVHLTLYNYDLPTVIEHVCGPFHRKYSVDWKLEVLGDGLLVVRTMVNKISIAVYIHEHEMRSCEYIEAVVGVRSQEEVARRLKEASDPLIRGFRINCSGE